MKKPASWIATALAVAVILVLCSCDKDNDEEEEAVRAPERVETVNGERVIKLARAEQEKAGIETAVLAGQTVEKTEQAYGTVMQVTELALTQESLIAAGEERDKADAAVRASRPEYERLKRLHADDRNASAKELEAAEAAFKADEAGARAAVQMLQSAEDQCRAQWGATICAWMAGPDPALVRLLQGKDALVLVTLAAGSGLESAPATALAGYGAGKPVEAALISASPRMDERLQGRAYFYAAPAAPSLLPGANVTALLATGAEEHGCVVPSSAPVWWEGKAWVYVKKGPERFTRREMPADRPLPDGWLVKGEEWPGTTVVVRGAEQLLSEEFRSSIRAEEDEE